MMKWLLSLLEKMGRKEILVDIYGQVHWERYYLLYYERDGFDWLPNVYIHHFPTNSPDGEDSHSHPWSTCGYVLRGSYMELINDNRIRKTSAGGRSPLSHEDRHRIIKCEPGTWTLFAHWFKRHPWRFFVKPHETLCDYCAEHNGGVCFKNEEVLDFTQFLSRAESDPAIPFSKRRTVKWVRVTPELKKQLERRRVALAKLAVNVPASKEEKYAAMKEIMVSRKKT